MSNKSNNINKKYKTKKVEKIIENAKTESEDAKTAGITSETIKTSDTKREAKNKAQEKVISIRDFILILSVIIVASICLLFMKMNSGNGRKVKVIADGKVVHEMSVAVDEEYIVIQDDKTNTVIVENGKVRVEDASCPDKICEKHIPISMNGETIICLPNKVVVEVCDE